MPGIVRGGRWALVSLPAASALALSMSACGASTPSPTDPGSPASPASPGPASETAGTAPRSAGSTASTGGGNVAHIECGDHHACAVLKDGSVACWGNDRAGQLGDGGGADKPRPVKVPGLAGIRQIALASTYGCAIGQDQKVQCWGSGRALGGEPLSQAGATTMNGLRATELSASGLLTCARLVGEGPRCWGASGKGPPDLGGGVAEIAVAATHGCARRDDGSVRCWGAETWGGSGKDALNKPTFPAPAMPPTEIGTGDGFACVLGKDKRVYCWGQNDLGQLGRAADFVVHDRPEAVPGVSDVDSLALGEASACALGNGKVTCWGSNSQGELGLGHKSPTEPPTVTRLPALKDLCFASTSACAQTTDDRMVCWGQNVSGELGDGTKRSSLVPVPVGL